MPSRFRISNDKWRKKKFAIKFIQLNSFDRLVFTYTTWIWMKWNRDRKLHLIFTSIFDSHTVLLCICILLYSISNLLLSIIFHIIINCFCVHYSILLLSFFSPLSLISIYFICTSTYTFYGFMKFIHMELFLLFISFSFHGNSSMLLVLYVYCASQINTLVKIKMTQSGIVWKKWIFCVLIKTYFFLLRHIMDTTKRKLFRTNLR